MDRRKSLVYCGAEEEDVEALREHDASFYGFSEAAVSSESPDTTSGSESDDGCSSVKQVDYGSDDDEVYSEGGDESSIANPDELQRGHFFAMIRDAKSSGCKCYTNHWQELNTDQLETLMMNIASMTKMKRKQYILGELAASAKPTQSDAFIRGVTVSYRVLGKSVCRDVFLEVHQISRTILKSLLKCVQAHETQPPVHGRTGHSAANKLPEETVKNVIHFLQHYSSCYGIPQPAAPRGRGKAAPVYLPVYCTKKKIHKLYTETDGAVQLSLTSFQDIWRQRASEILIMKPRTDVCAKCEKYRENVKLAKTEESTREAMQQLTSHLDEAHEEREFYKAEIASVQKILGETEVGDVPAEAHITFDFAQQLELPHHTRQVGPIYFKSRFKVHLFGICDEPRNQQHNYLFHEGETIGVDGTKARSQHSY